MKGLISAFGQFLKNIWGDYMLVVCLFAPILMGSAFKFGLPQVERLLVQIVHIQVSLEPYYVLFDLLLTYMTPLMLCFAGVMVMLEELDNGTAKYLMVTPIGKFGYIFSRIGMITGISILYNIIVTQVFSLVIFKMSHIALLAFLNSIIAIDVAMLVISFAKNKVEGMALIKLSGFMIVGFIAVYFDQSPYLAIFGVLPSYWVGKIIIQGEFIHIMTCLLVSCVWMWILSNKFSRRVFQ